MIIKLFWEHFGFCPENKMNCVWSAGSDSSDVKPGGVFFSGKPAIRRAMELADGLVFDSPEKRLEIPICMDPSDEEEEGDEEMEVIFCLCQQ